MVRHRWIVQGLVYTSMLQRIGATTTAPPRQAEGRRPLQPRATNPGPLPPSEPREACGERPRPPTASDPRPLAPDGPGSLARAAPEREAERPRARTDAAPPTPESGPGPLRQAIPGP